MNLNSIAIVLIIVNPLIIFSQEKEEKTPLWIEKGEKIISIKPGARIAIKEPQNSIEKIVKYIDVDHRFRKIYYLQDDKKILTEHNFKDIEYLKPLKRGVQYAAKVVTLSGLLGAGLGYYSLNSKKSIKYDSEGIFQAALAGAIAGGFVGSFLLSEKRAYISHFVYIDEDGEVVNDFPEVFLFSENEWKFIE